MSLRLSTFTLGLILIASAHIYAATATELLAEDLAPAIKILPRETRLYHYFGINFGGKSLEKTNLRNAEDRYALVNDRMKAFAGGFWDLDNHTTKLANAGLGLYLAVDPYASSPDAAADTGANFGSNLIEITFNAGTKYLDLVNAVTLRPETMQALIDETGLQPEDIKKLFEGKKKGFYRDTLQYMAEKQNTTFRKIVQSLFISQGIVMTEYGWQAATSAFCNVTTGSGKIHHSSMVYVGNSLTHESIKSINMIYFEPTTVQFDAQESESLVRNKKLYNVLQALRPLEKQYQSAAQSDDKELMKLIYQGMKDTISSTYTDEAEVQDLRLKTFDCVK